MIDEEIVSFVLGNGERLSTAYPEPPPDEALGQVDAALERRYRSALRNGRKLPSILPLLDLLSQAHPDTPPDELVGQVDAALDRLYRAGRVSYAGHRWLSDPPATVAGNLNALRPELRFDATTGTWSWTGTAWTHNIAVL